MGGIVNAVGSAFSSAGKAVGGAVSSAAGDAANAVDDAGKAVSTAGKDVQGAVNGAGNWVDNHVDNAVDSFEKSSIGNNVIGHALGSAVEDTTHFSTGVASGATTLVSGTAELAGGAMQYASNSQFRDNANKTIGYIASHPGQVASSVWNQGVQAFEKDPAHAAGELVGIVGSAVLTGGAGLGGDAGEGAAVAGDVADAANAASKVGDAADAANAASKVGDAADAANAASKVGDAADAANAAKYQATLDKLADPNANMTVVKDLSDGSHINQTQIVKLDNGEMGVWKPSAGESSNSYRTFIPAGTQSQREAAASVIGQNLGIPEATPTVFRQFGEEQGTFSKIGNFIRSNFPTVFKQPEDNSGALMHFVPDSQTAADIGKTAGRVFNEDPAAYSRMNLYDNVIGNLDRHAGNWMVDDQGNIHAIDNGLSFPTENNPLQDGNFDFGKPMNLNNETRNSLENLAANKNAVNQQLSRFLEPKAIQSMWDRVDNILQTGKTNSWWKVDHWGTPNP